MSTAADLVATISESFVSIQGEGPSVGTPSVFVRLQGCDVGCSWCDTKYSWDPRGGRDVSLARLLDDVRAAGVENVVVTGGEPLQHPVFETLVLALKARSHRVEVETSGVEVPPHVDVDQWNVSVKLAHSGVPETRRLRPDAITRFRDLGAWFKFVVAGEEDVDEVAALAGRFGIPARRIVLMPLGMQREEQIARMPDVIRWCVERGFRFSPRLHILVWGPKRGV